MTLCVAFHWQYGGYWQTTTFLKEADRSGETTFYDSVTGRPLFIAPRGRTWEQFEAESRSHGWPSFRCGERVWSHADRGTVQLKFCFQEAILY